jgi:hypothetical protein
VCWRLGVCERCVHLAHGAFKASGSTGTMRLCGGLQGYSHNAHALHARRRARLADQLMIARLRCASACVRWPHAAQGAETLRGSGPKPYRNRQPGLRPVLRMQPTMLRFVTKSAHTGRILRTYLAATTRGVLRVHVLASPSSAGLAAGSAARPGHGLGCARRRGSAHAAGDCCSARLPWRRAVARCGKRERARASRRRPLAVRRLSRGGPLKWAQ